MSFPRLIKILPFFLVLPILRLAVLSLRRKEWERTRALAALSVLSLFAVFSISYLPDFVHIALITPFFFVIIAEELESVLGWLPTGAQSTVRWIVALSVLGAGIVRLHDNLGTARGIATQPYESAFGRVDIPPSYADFYERLDALLRDVPGRTLYVHPDASYTYLLVGACNPTRFEFVNLPYHGLKEVQEVVDDLEATAPPYVLVRQYLLKRDDPIFRLIQERYEPLEGWPPQLSMWRLRSLAGASDRTGVVNADSAPNP